MYPLAFIFLINLLYPDDKVIKYSLPLTTIGLLISIYHNLLIYDIIPIDLSPCVQGVPCSTRYLDFGFITIPFLSLVAFSSILVLLILSLKKEKF